MARPPLPPSLAPLQLPRSPLPAPSIPVSAPFECPSTKSTIPRRMAACLRKSKMAGRKYTNSSAPLEVEDHGSLIT